MDTSKKELNTIKSRSEQKTRKLEQQLAKLQTKVKEEKLMAQKTLKRKPKSILDKNIQTGSEYLGNSDLLIEQLFAERKRAKDLDKQLEVHPSRSQDSGRHGRFITMGLQESLDQRYKNSLNHVQTKVEYQPLSRPKTPVHDCLKTQAIRLVAYKPAICKNEQCLITEQSNKQINRGTKAVETGKTVDGFTMTESLIKYDTPHPPAFTKESDDAMQKESCTMTPNDVKQTLDCIIRDLCTCKKMLRHQKALNLQRRNISRNAKAKLYDQKTRDALKDKKIKPKSKKTNTKPVRKVIPNKRVPNSRRVANNELHKSNPRYDNAISSIKKPLLSTKETKQKTIHHKQKFRSIIHGDSLSESLYTLLPSKISKMHRQSSPNKLVIEYGKRNNSMKSIKGQSDHEIFKKQSQSNLNEVKWTRAKEFQTENLDRQYDPNTKDPPIDSTEEFYLASVSNARINVSYNNIKFDVEDEKLKVNAEGLTDIEQKESEILLKEKQINCEIFRDEPLDHMQSESNLEQNQTITQTSSVMPYNINDKSLKNNRDVNDFPIMRHDLYTGNTESFQFMKKDSALRNTQKSKCDDILSVSKNKMTTVGDLLIVVPPEAFLTIRIGKLQLSSDAKKLTRNSYIFLNWQFYTMEIRYTPIKSDQNTSYDYMTNYNISLLPELVQYLKNNKVCIEVHYTVDNHSEMFGMCLLPLHQVIENPNIWMSFELDVDSVPTNKSTSRSIIISNYGHLEVDCILHINFGAIPKLVRLCLASPDEDVDITRQDAIGSNHLYKNNNSYIPTRKSNDSTKSQKFSLCEDSHPTGYAAISSKKSENFENGHRRSTDGMKKRLSFEADGLQPQRETERRPSIGRKSLLRTLHSKSITSTTSTDGNQSIAITIRWLKLLPDLIQFSRELLTEIFIDYSFLSHFGEEMETPNSLIRPTMADEKLDYNFRKVFNVDLNINPMDRTLLILLLEGVKTKSEIEFYAVSEPLEDPLDIETAEDFGKAVLSINNMLKDNPLEDSCVVLLPLTTLNGEKRIGSLSVGVEGLDVMRDLKP